MLNTMQNNTANVTFNIVLDPFYNDPLKFGVRFFSLNVEY